MRSHEPLRVPSPVPVLCLLVLATLLGGCGGYVLKGRAVVGANFIPPVSPTFYLGSRLFVTVDIRR